MDAKSLWERYKKYFWNDTECGIALDISRVNFPDSFFASMQERAKKAFSAMQQLEAGSLANPDESRTVGHYWLRNPELTPNPDIRSAIHCALGQIHEFTRQVHSGKIQASTGGRFQSILIIGIGGSALGPQFVTKALGSASDAMQAYYFDNTDPDGMAYVLSAIPDLSKTMCIVISKSGGTKETRNGMLVAKHAFQAQGQQYAKNFVAVTCSGSELDKLAEKEGWLARFPMWDWVGGRTSELSAVGLLPAALQGYDIDEMLRGAKEIDEITRVPEISKNPAMLMALCWYFLGDGKGAKDMVVLPYNDRLELFSRYLQQLVMESLGKEHDLDGKIVNQGIAVYGNKGSTDQHAYVQQLRDGLNNFFAVFIQVLSNRCPKTVASALQGQLPKGFSSYDLEVDPGITSGDYLCGFFQGTRRALFEKGRQSITITIDEVSEYSVGQLIGLFERAVGFYASLVNINAYHQPGVEAGKKAAGEVLALQSKVLKFLGEAKRPMTSAQIAAELALKELEETIFLTMRHLAANARVKVVSGATVFDDAYQVS